MVYYKLYDRNTLQLVDSGVVRDYNIDFDYMTNNSSTLNMTSESRGFKGDIAFHNQFSSYYAVVGEMRNQSPANTPAPVDSGEE